MRQLLTDKYKGLEAAIRIRIGAKIGEKGVESKHRSEKVLKVVNDNHKFNLEGGRYLTEITATELIDNCGYTYNHNVLSVGDLCEVVDAI